MQALQREWQDTPPVLFSLPPMSNVDHYLRALRWQFVCKRVLDIILAAILLCVLSPVFVLVAVAIRLESPGPAFFTQLRWGWEERLFRCYKFRTMYVNAAGAAPAAEANGILFKIPADPRVTRVGRVLRRTSIDELPQLWNVLRGDMSLVGPRPLVLHMLVPYPELRAVRCRVRPGLTGPWQVNDRANNTHVSAMAPWDLEYITGANLLVDCRILLRTIGAVLSGRGAV